MYRVSFMTAKGQKGSVVRRYRECLALYEGLVCSPFAGEVGVTEGGFAPKVRVEEIIPVQYWCPYVYE